MKKKIIIIENLGKKKNQHYFLKFKFNSFQIE